MQLQEMNAARLRALTEVEIPAGRVVSLYLDLGPGGFPAQSARSSAIRSVVDELGRRIDEIAGELDHAELVALREDRARIEEFLSDELDPDGARGVAVFACGLAGLWEVIRVPHAVPNEVAIGTVPHIEQLVWDLDGGRWAVVLVSRSHGRVLRGDGRRLVETIARHDEVHGQHDQGGWSQPRYQRSVDREADEHVDAFLETLYREYRRRPFDHLLFVASGELWPSIETSLHSDLRPLVAGRVDADLEQAGPDEVLEVARPQIERVEAERRRELLARLSHGLGTGERATAGPEPTLDALVQQRVEALLLVEGFAASGTTCPACGWLGAGADVTRCPVDGSELRRHDSIVDVAVAAALQQDAAVMIVPRYEAPDDPDAAPSASYLQLQGHGGMAAVLRF
jgi:peptide chain release factor subunit 1